ncbi:MAG: hypothetical protein KDB49_02730, partial [Mycobacterium sp.]|nr:hypothetical protein [Mycobacterium sp.]
TTKVVSRSARSAAGSTSAKLSCASAGEPATAVDGKHGHRQRAGATPAATELGPAELVGSPG